MNRFLALAATAALALGVGAANAADKLKIGFVYVGPVGDFGYSYQHDQGRKAVEEALGDKVETTFVENVAEGPDAERVIESLARGGNKLIFTTSFGFMEPTLKVAKKFPDVKFEHATGYKRAAEPRDLFRPLLRGPLRHGADRGQDVEDRHHRLCRLLSRSPRSSPGINSFMLGAQSVKPDMKVKIVWVNSWYDPGKEADAAKALVGAGRRHPDPAHRQPCRHAGRRGEGHLRLRPGLRHDQVRAQGAAHGQRRGLGQVLYAACPSLRSTASGPRPTPGTA